MKKILIYLAILMIPVVLGQSAYAQLVVSDPGVETETGIIDGELTAANTELAAIARATQATATTTAETLTMMNTPTITSGTAASMDGTAAANASAALAQILPALLGSTSISATATELANQVKSGVTLDETTGIVSGNPADEQAQRQLQANANIQSLAVDDFRTAIGRFDTAGTLLEARLDTSPNLKTATSLNGEIGVITLRELLLVHKTLALGVAAQAQARLDEVAEKQRIEKDHKQAALQFAVTP